MTYAEAMIELNKIDESVLEAINSVRARAYGVKSSETDKDVYKRQAGKLSNKEIASQLDLTERAVEAHFYRTMKLLKEELRKFI